MLLLVQKTYEGEPIGVWNQGGDSAYAPGNDALKAKAQARIRDIPASKPWAVAVDEFTGKINHIFWWGQMNSNLSLAGALSLARDNFFSDQAGNVSVSKENASPVSSSSQSGS